MDVDRDPGTEDEATAPATWAQSHGFVPTTFIRPALRFSRQESAGGIVMLVAAVAALLWANSPLGDTYFALLDTRIEIAFGDFRFEHLSELTVKEWINDAAMVLFFFVVGLEIKRQLIVGELRDPRVAVLPVIAAVGGMLVPAGIYLLFNLVLLPDGAATAGAWGIPMATDIAFAVGIVAMLGRRVPVAGKLFLLALAIVDDLGAILVIALVYTDQVHVGWLVASGLGLFALWAMNRLNVRSDVVHVVIGVAVWVAMLESGVHATLAGVAIALLTPVTSFYDPREFHLSARPLLDSIEEYLPDDIPLHAADHHTLERVSSIVADLRRLSYETLPPLSRLEFRLSPISSMVIVPVFALANAGVVISTDVLVAAPRDPVLLGVAFGLVVGKTVGVASFAWFAVRSGIARMPRHTTWRHIVGLAMLAGIGFTVALFVTSLSLTGAAVDSAKIGVFLGSLLAGGGGYLFLRTTEPPGAAGDRPEAATAADEPASATT